MDAPLPTTAGAGSTVGGDDGGEMNDNNRGLPSHIHTRISELQLLNESKTVFFDVCKKEIFEMGKLMGNGPLDLPEFTPLRHSALPRGGEDLEGQDVKHDGEKSDGGDDYCRKAQLPSLLMGGFSFHGRLFDGGHGALQLFGEFFDMRGILGGGGLQFANLLLQQLCLVGSGSRTFFGKRRSGGRYNGSDMGKYGLECWYQPHCHRDVLTRIVEMKAYE